MCDLFAGQNPALYENVTRSIRLNGYATSIRLEAYFWAVLDEIARAEGMTTPRFLSVLHDEVVERRGAVGNFSSLLRVVCAVYLKEPAAHAARLAKRVEHLVA